MAMTDTELRALLAAEEADCLGHLSGTLSEDRRKAMEYYFGEQTGDLSKQDGRSGVVSTDVSDTIEWIMPSLVRIFLSGDEFVRFEPVGPEDEEAAKQATDYVNFVVQRDNNGFVAFYSMFKDALLQKTGHAKVYWESEEKREEKPFSDLPPDAFAATALEYQGWELEDHAEADGLHSGMFTRAKQTGKVCIDPIPPEEFLISRRARTIAEASMVAHRCRKTRSELIEAGYDKKVVDTLGSDETDTTGERTTRDNPVDGAADDPGNQLNRAMERVWVTEAYVKVDCDGDGVAELRRITYAGKAATILTRDGKPDNEEWEGPRPFVAITPIIMPHRFTGISVADLVMDLQLIKSTIMRQMLDNLYLTNNPRHVVSDQVNLDDMLTNRPGGLVRLLNGAMPAQGHVLPLETPFVAGSVFPALEYFDQVRENRVGVTRYNQGTDSNSLNKTASGISQIMTAAQQRIELIARVFAETGLRDLCRLVLWNLRHYPEESKRVIRLRNKWVELDPAAWPDEFDTTVNVGLGTGSQETRIQQLMMLMQLQMQAVQLQGGPTGPLVTLDNLYETAKRIVETMGWKAPELFVSDPAEQPPQPPRPDPKMIELQGKMEMEKAKLGMDQQKTQAQFALDQQKAQADIELQRAKLEADIALQREKMMGQLVMDREKMTLDMQMGGERFNQEMEARKGRDLMETRASMGMPPDAETSVLEALQAGQEQIVQGLVMLAQRQDQGLSAILQAVSAPKHVMVQRDGAGRITGATATPTIQ